MFNNAYVLVEQNNAGVHMIEYLQRMGVNVDSFKTDRLERQTGVRFLKQEMKAGHVWFPGSSSPSEKDPHEHELVTALKQELMNLGIRKQGNVEVIRALAGHDDLCCHPDTRINMGNGEYKPIKEITPGDKVLAHTGRLTRVTRTYVRKYSGNLIQINAVGSIPILLTPNHPVRVIKRDNKYVWKQASELKKGDKLQFTFDKTTNYMDNPDLFKLIGIFLAEGCTSTKNRVTFNLSIDEINLAKEIKEFIIKLFQETPNISINKQRHSLTISKKSKKLHSFFNQFYKHKKKYIPRHILNNSSSNLLYLVYYYLLGDGCYHNGSWSANSNSHTLIQQLRLILMRQSLVTTITSLNESSKFWNNKRYLTKKQYILMMSTLVSNKFNKLVNHDGFKKLNQSKSYVTLGKYGLVPKVKSIKLVPYSGKVYNLETNQHTYIPENITVHNCDALWIANNAAQRMQSARVFCAFAKIN
jgi:hypothetical protein